MINMRFLSALVVLWAGLWIMFGFLLDKAMTR